MKRKNLSRILLELAALLLILGGIWFGLNQLNIFPEKVDVSLSPEQESKLGKVMIEAMLSDHTSLNDPTVDSAIVAVSARLIAGLEKPAYDYKFYVVEDPAINAFIGPGGHIVIFSGLLKFSETPEELAAVLAHEIGHAEKKHVIRNLVREIGLTVLVSILAGDNSGALASVLKTATSSAFSRNQEREADEFGMNLLSQSGVHPRSLAEFFRRMEEEKGDIPIALSILATHPRHEERIENSQSFLVPSNFQPKPFDLNWDRVRDACAKY